MFNSTNCLRILYFALVRFILKYGVIFWHIYLAKDKLRVKLVQPKCLSYAYIHKIQYSPHDYFIILNSF